MVWRPRPGILMVFGAIAKTRPGSLAQVGVLLPLSIDPVDPVLGDGEQHILAVARSKGCFLAIRVVICGLSQAAGRPASRSPQLMQILLPIRRPTRPKCPPDHASVADAAAHSTRLPVFVETGAVCSPSDRQPVSGPDVAPQALKPTARQVVPDCGSETVDQDPAREFCDALLALSPPPHRHLHRQPGRPSRSFSYRADIVGWIESSLPLTACCTGAKCR